MKVLCVGFWKTGTKSLSKALSLLGYKVLDYEEQIVFLSKTWHQFLDGTITDQDIYDTFKDIDVLIDGPVIVFWEEIYRVFPEAKVILTKRDEESWWKSWKNMNDKFFAGSLLLRLGLMLSPAATDFTTLAQRIFSLAYGIETGRFFLSWTPNERLYKMKYRKHNCYVLHTVPGDKRLVHESKHGWKPLCDYLDHEVPDIPYPHQNKNASLFEDQKTKSPLFRKIISEMKIIGAVVIAVLALILFLYAVV